MPKYIILFLAVVIAIAVVYRRKINLLYWTPRFLAILIIIIMIAMSMDSVSYETTLGNKANNFLMNNSTF